MKNSQLKKKKKLHSPSIAKVVVTDTISILKHSNLRSWNKESEKILLNTATDQVVIFLHVSPNFTW